VRQFSPAVIIDVITLRPSLPCTAADHTGAWRGSCGPPTCMTLYVGGHFWDLHMWDVWSLIMDRCSDNSMDLELLWWMLRQWCNSRGQPSLQWIATTPTVLSVWCSIHKVWEQKTDSEWVTGSKNVNGGVKWSSLVGVHRNEQSCMLIGLPTARSHQLAPAAIVNEMALWSPGVGGVHWLTHCCHRIL